MHMTGAEGFALTAMHGPSLGRPLSDYTMKLGPAHTMKLGPAHRRDGKSPAGMKQYRDKGGGGGKAELSSLMEIGPAGKQAFLRLTVPLTEKFSQTGV